MHKLATLDQRFIWHPFTQMRDWLEREPIVIMRGKGAELWDVHGRKYLDANASIWTNLHGHGHPVINAAIKAQLKKIAHSSALGLANEPASLLAERLVKAANPEPGLEPPLNKIFYSDNGSTALEVALKLAYEYCRRTDRGPRPKFLSLSGAYHGDTVGAVSLGHIDLFHRTWAGLLFRSDVLPAPYCYRCKFNQAHPERADARAYRRCRAECRTLVERKFELQKRRGEGYAGFVFEPLIQGAAGMIPQPAGWLADVTAIARAHGALLLADEVMTGFGRTGVRPRSGKDGRASLFACHQEGVQPDFLAVAKGLTGGYMPMAATLTTQEVFDAFLGDYAEFKTFFHGHSYTGNQLGSAAALASIKLLSGRQSVRARANLQQALADRLSPLWQLPNVGDIRQVGLIAGIELVQDWRTRKPFPLEERVGIRVCEAMAKAGVLTRPVGNVIVLMPPYCTTHAQLDKMVGALERSIRTCDLR